MPRISGYRIRRPFDVYDSFSPRMDPNRSFSVRLFGDVNIGQGHLSNVQVPEQLYCDPRRGIVTHTSGLPFFYCAYIWQYKAGRPVISPAIYEAAKIILEHLKVQGTGEQRGPPHKNNQHEKRQSLFH